MHGATLTDGAGVGYLLKRCLRSDFETQGHG